MMTERQQRVCIWGGITFAPLFFVGFWLLAGFIPPPAPGMSAEAVARMFAEHRGRIRAGLWVATAAAPFLAFFVAALTHQIRRIAGSDSPLATAQADRRIVLDPRVHLPAAGVADRGVPG